MLGRRKECGHCQRNTQSTRNTVFLLSPLSLCIQKEEHAREKNADLDATYHGDKSSPLHSLGPFPLCRPSTALDLLEIAANETEKRSTHQHTAAPGPRSQQGNGNPQAPHQAQKHCSWLSFSFAPALISIKRASFKWTAPLPDIRRYKGGLQRRH